MNVKVITYLSLKTGCKLENVLVFFTGADCIPPLGFNHEPNVSFLHDESANFALKAHVIWSCDCHAVTRIITEHLEKLL